MSQTSQGNVSRVPIALAIGDPAGVGPELAAKLAAHSDVAAATHLIVIDDRRILERGEAEMGVVLDLEPLTLADAAAPAGSHVFVELAHLNLLSIERSVLSQAGGRFALYNFTACLRLVQAGKVAAV